MIIEVNGKRIRKQRYRAYKILLLQHIEYELHCIDRQNHCIVNIDLKYGGRIATSIGTHFAFGEEIKRREISFTKLPDKVKKQVVEAITYIEKNGTPMENDESVFS